jgi:hypothetical protein
MRKVSNVIKKLVNYGIILLGFSLFIGCEIPYYPVDEYGEYSNGNEYYHLTLSREHWQTLHKVSGVITDDYDNFVEGFWLEWDSNLYWYLGDTLGYIVTRHLTDSGTYVGVETSYIIGFNGQEVPTSNMVSYSNGYGQFNNMIAPVQSMVGDTLTLTANWNGGKRSFNIVLD